MSEGKESETSQGVSRRAFMKKAAAGAGAVTFGGILSACGSSSSSSSPSATQNSTASSTAWKFGIMSDTQWTSPPGDDGADPNTSAMSIGTQIQQQFINQGVKLVVHVGDLCDDGSTAGEQTRALFAQALYNAGIGFFPLRGNHDDGAADAALFQTLYPQTQNGVFNAAANPLGSFAKTDPNVLKDAGSLPPVAQSGSQFSLGANFSSPDPWGNGNLKGLSYAFDFNNVRFVLLDQFTPPGTTPSNYTMDTTIGLQQPWISSQLSGRASGNHAFVFAHKGLITCQHADGLFSLTSPTGTTLATNSSNPAYNPTQQNNFIMSLFQNKVKYYIHGHDHMYDRSIVTTTDGKSGNVMQILTASDSAKFYVPSGSGNNTTSPSGVYSNDYYWNVMQAGGVMRRTPVTQELYTVGYYIVTVDGSNITVDYYSAAVYPYQSSVSELIVSSAQGLNFAKRETFGYGLSGQQFLVQQGKPYSVVQDTSPNGTKAKILSGTNNNLSKDANQVACVKAVNTGWAAATSATMSDILKLWGVNPYAGGQPDTYVLSLNLNMTGINPASGKVGIAVQKSDGSWTNAVNNNSAGSLNYVNGPWSANYGLGTYGIDQASSTAWAVLNYDGTFAVVNGI